MNCNCQTHSSIVDRLDVVDALYRFGAGQDLNDAQLFESAFSQDARLDFVQPAKRLGVDLPVFEGRQAIVTSIIAAVAALDTTHTVTNPRATVSGHTAHLLALVEAQHLPKDDGSRYLLLKNWYDVHLVKEESLWRMRHVRITNVWMRGDAEVLFPASS